MPTRFLSDAEKRYGQERLFWSEIFNGFSSIFLGDTLVFLLAVHFNAGNMVLGLISSGLYVAGLAVPPLLRLFSGLNQEKCHSFFWHMRGVVSLGYVTLFFLKGPWAVAVLVLTYALFCVFRALGVVFNDLTCKNVSSIQNRGAVLSRFNTAYQSSSLLAKVCSAFVTGIKALPALVGIIGLQLFGIFINIFGSIEYGRVPCRRFVEGRKVPFLQLMRDSLRSKDISHPVALKAVYICVLILVQMAIPFLSNVLRLGNNLVLSYTVIVAVGMMLSGFVTKRYSDRVGAKPLIVLSSVMLSIVMCIWILLPGSVHFSVFFVLGFFANFFINCINMMVNKIMAPVIPEDNPIGFSSFVNFVIAIFSLVTGFVAGYAVDLGAFIGGGVDVWGVALGNSYSFCFLLAVILLTAGHALSLSIKERGSLSASQAAQALFSMHGLKAFSMIEKIERTKDPIKRRILLMGLGTNLTGVATSEIRMKLASPFSPDKVEIIRALGDRPRPALVADLAKIALNDDSYVQLDAIGALGGYVDDPIAKEALIALLDCKWGSSRSMASKSLSRFTGSEEFLPRINALSLASRHIDEEIDYLVAKRNMDKEGLFYQDFFVSVQKMHSATYRQTRYALIASFLKFGSPRLAYLYELMNTGTAADFLEDFLPEARYLDEIDSHYDEVFKAFQEKDREYLRSFCLDMVSRSDVSYSSSFENLKTGLMKAADMDINAFDVQDMLALLYFAYSLRMVSK